MCESCNALTQVADGGLCRHCIEEARRDPLEMCESCNIPAVLWQGGLCGHCYEAAFSDDFTTETEDCQDLDYVIEQSMIEQHLETVEKQLCALREIIQRSSGDDYLKAYHDRIRSRHAAKNTEITISVCMQEACSGVPDYGVITTMIFSFLLNDEEVDLRPFQNALEYVLVGSVYAYSRSLFKDATNLKALSLIQYGENLSVQELRNLQLNLFNFKLDLVKRQEEIRHDNAMRLFEFETEEPITNRV